MFSDGPIYFVAADVDLFACIAIITADALERAHFILQ